MISVNGEHVCGSPRAGSRLWESFTREKYIQGHSVILPSASSCFSPGQGVCSQALLVKPFQSKPVGERGSTRGMFRGLWGLTVINRNEIAVNDYGNYRIQIFDSSGTFIRSFGQGELRRGPYGMYFDSNRNLSPTGICFDNKGSIFVSDKKNHKLQIFNEEGSYTGMFGGNGSFDSQLSYPLSLNSDGNIIVADSGNKLIKIFSPEGKFVRKVGGPGFFSQPVHCVQYDRYLVVSMNTALKCPIGRENTKISLESKEKGTGSLNTPGVWR